MYNQLYLQLCYCNEQLRDIHIDLKECIEVVSEDADLPSALRGLCRHIDDKLDELEEQKNRLQEMACVCETAIAKVENGYNSN